MNFRKIIHLSLSIIKRPILFLRKNKIGYTTEIHTNPLDLRNIKMGQYGYIGKYCSINNANIGNYCSIAQFVIIGAMEHAVNDLSTSTWLSNLGKDSGLTTIKDDVWIAAGSIIRQGVTIGKGAVVGANSFVNKDVPDYAIVAGSPAKLIRYRFDQEIIQKLTASDFLKHNAERAFEELNAIRNGINI